MALFAFGALLSQLLVSLAITVVAYVMMPKPKTSAPAELTDLEVPTAESGVPMIVVWGDITVKSPNITWYGEKRTERAEV